MSALTQALIFHRIAENVVRRVFGPLDEKVRSAIGLVQERITYWQLDGRPFFDGETEACINGKIT